MSRISFACACKKAEQYLESCGIEDAPVDAWYLLEYVTGLSRADYLADRDKCMSEKQRDAYTALVNRRGAHIPLQHLTGEQEFMGLSFQVNEHVLIPRQDTETLVELALEKIEACAAAETESGQTFRKTVQKPAKETRVLDLCTGSGCIAVSLSKLWEQRRTKASQKIYLRITASDISGEALAVARENARRLRADVRIVQSDLFSDISVNPSDALDESAGGYLGKFHLIVSNPPYIRTQVIGELSEEVRMHEPRMALDGGEDGLDFYRRIIGESRTYLLPDGWLLLEIGFDQGEKVSDLMRRNGFSEVQVAKDLAGHDRVVLGRNI